MQLGLHEIICSCYATDFDFTIFFGTFLVFHFRYYVKLKTIQFKGLSKTSVKIIIILLDFQVPFTDTNPLIVCYSISIIRDSQ